MKRVIVWGVLAGLVLLLSGFSVSPISPVEGSWTGEFKSGSATLAFQVHFRAEEGVLVGTVDIPKEHIYGAPLDWIMVDSSSVHFELVRDGTSSVFDGELKNGRIVGECFTASKGSFYLISSAVAAL